jgi:hypothetical protein
MWKNKVIFHILLLNLKNPNIWNACKKTFVHSSSLKSSFILYLLQPLGLSSSLGQRQWNNVKASKKHGENEIFIEMNVGVFVIQNES